MMITGIRHLLSALCQYKIPRKEASTKVWKRLAADSDVKSTKGKIICLLIVCTFQTLALSARHDICKAYRAVDERL